MLRNAFCWNGAMKNVMSLCLHQSPDNGFEREPSLSSGFANGPQTQLQQLSTDWLALDLSYL
jgi:hypothetical protein